MSSPRRFPADLCEIMFGAMVPFYQCDIYCVLQFTGRLDYERLTTAFLAALAEEPMWSYRFVPAFWRPYWKPIPRDARRDLVSFVETDGTTAAIASIMQGSVEAAVTLALLHGPTDDALCLCVDHRLGDATAAALLINSIAAHYRARTPVPEADAPVVRRTIEMFRSVVPEPQREEFMAALRKEQAELRKAPALFRLPEVTAADPADLPVLLAYPDGALEVLTARAMRDRATPNLAILAALELAMRDVVDIDPDAALELATMVNLRRYLPAERLPAPACMLIGQAKIKVQHAAGATMPEVVQQLRDRMKAERGPHFGLRRSPVAADVPRVRFFMRLIPFALLRFGVHSIYRNFKMTPDVCVSDLGEFGRPGEVWGDAVLRNAYSQAGVWNIPSISVCVSTCGSRFSVSVGARPRSFARRLATAIQQHLHDYFGGSPLP